MVLPEHSACCSAPLASAQKRCLPALSATAAHAAPPARQPALLAAPVAMSVAEVLEDLPAEMQQAVFSHLDLPSVRALRRVSAGLHAIIGSRDFQKARHSVGRAG